MRRRHFITPLLAGAAIVLSGAGAVHADLGDQLFKLFADDGAENDWFGFSVGISGTIGIAGARGDDDNGPRSGSAYLFDVMTGEQIAKLLADDGAVDDEFGKSVAISGATAVVGTIWDDNENGEDAGAAYLFDVTDPSDPVQIAKLLADDGAEADRFGFSVAISGAPGKETAIVGAIYDDDNGTDSGSAYLFDATTGKQSAKLLPDDGGPYDYFGRSVAISGNTAIVGAPYRAGPGAAYLFDATSGQLISKLHPNDGGPNILFGYSVGISGTTAIVGAYYDDDSGSAYVFDISDPGHPVQVAKLLADDGSLWFGFSVAISGATAIVGANRDSENGSWAGAAYLFDITTGRQIAKLMAADDRPQSAELGTSVGISGAPGNEIAIVGVGIDEDLGERAGAAYLFDASAAPGQCPWDLDDSGGIGTGDLILLLGSWGDPYGTPDLIELLGNWGPCE